MSLIWKQRSELVSLMERAACPTRQVALRHIPPHHIFYLPPRVYTASSYCEPLSSQRLMQPQPARP